MVIRNNLSAMNTNRMLKNVQNNLINTTQKLSSGYSINKAADNAAGLSISEKMRKKIRGLNRGKDNIQEGISLCQTADGALNEITDMLQRVRELSIKAYNGTNSANDRDKIQDEIDQCLEEMDRVFDTTKFNDIYIFKTQEHVSGSLGTHHVETITYTRTERHTLFRDVPDWLKINDVSAQNNNLEIAPHPSYPVTQDTSNIMLQHLKYTDSNGDSQNVYLYYGPNSGVKNLYGNNYISIEDFAKDSTTDAFSRLMTQNTDFSNYITNHFTFDSNINGYTGYTGWTTTIDDNASAKLSFDGLIANTTDIQSLYDNTFGLLGVELAFPCGTCKQNVNREAIRFSGSLDAFQVDSFTNQGTYANLSDINITTTPFNWNGKNYNGYFEAITDVMLLDDSNPQKATLTSDLSKAIAKDLTDKTYNTLNSAMVNHYDRVARDASDPYSVYIYDFRDTDAIDRSNNATVDSKIRTSAHITFTQKFVDTETFDYYTGGTRDYMRDGKIWIQCSDSVPDGMYINLKNLSVDKLGLKGYNIANYPIIQHDDPTYKTRLSEWEDKNKPIMQTYSGYVTVIDSYTPPRYNISMVNGEIKTELIQNAQIVTKQVFKNDLTRWVYPPNTEPKPTPNYTYTEEYDPSDVSLIDDALKTICTTRSYFGASQNRLEHAYAVNYNSEENITAAESKIRDTDMSKEIFKNSLFSMLQQASFSMLTQANSSNQGVLSLLS